MSVTETVAAVEPPRPTGGVDWAKDDHAVAVVAPDGEQTSRFSVSHDAAGLRNLVKRLLTAGVAEVGIERPDGPVVDALRQAGLTVFVIPPGQLKNLRSRYGSAGNKDDRFDAYVLADVVRTDRRRLRPLLVDTPATTVLRQSVRARRDLVAHRVAVANQLRAHLQICFPGAVGLFRDIDSDISLRFLDRFTHQGQADWLTPRRLAAWLASVGYCGRVDPTVLHARLTAAPRGTTGSDAHTSAAVTTAFVTVLRTLTSQIEALAARISEQLDLHPDAPLFTSLPRSGCVRAARLLAEIGDARGRFPTADSLACLAGVAPSTRQSGKVTAVSFPTRSATLPATAAMPIPGPPTSTAAPAPADTTIPTPSGSSPGPGSMSSGPAGPPTPPTTPTATARSNASSTKINRRRLDTGQLIALPRCAQSALREALC
jgi:transposase